ncbi:hypothetical protein PPERSA_02097 [Pseudocohnilembus persalinus]|uniref:Uncharacterized protein n=1 Tax=Pseudocohnilembus persalinus TaxID=266149 RepID=A0A0V0Q7X7_PSEPJ|nr:hypothetical protein PPERSA_02097 [Pseudocohnilembus persalinus]|eukprot:KRW98320.1 hypothetical protein PPERSA_02097 [Pseudocohnilembus persalinus]
MKQAYFSTYFFYLTNFIDNIQTEVEKDRREIMNLKQRIQNLQFVPKEERQIEEESNLKNKLGNLEQKIKTKQYEAQQKEQQKVNLDQMEKQIEKKQEQNKQQKEILILKQEQEQKLQKQQEISVVQANSPVQIDKMKEQNKAKQQNQVIPQKNQNIKQNKKAEIISYDNYIQIYQKGSQKFLQENNYLDKKQWTNNLSFVLQEADRIVNGSINKKLDNLVNEKAWDKYGSAIYKEIFDYFLRKQIKGDMLPETNPNTPYIKQILKQFEEKYKYDYSENKNMKKEILWICLYGMLIKMLDLQGHTVPQQFILGFLFDEMKYLLHNKWDKTNYAPDGFQKIYQANSNDFKSHWVQQLEADIILLLYIISTDFLYLLQTGKMIQKLNYGSVFRQKIFEMSGKYFQLFPNDCFLVLYFFPFFSVQIKKIWPFVLIFIFFFSIIKIFY